MSLQRVQLTKPKKKTHCRAKDGLGFQTITCCSFCRRNSPDKHPYGICCPTTGRKCFDMHVAARVKMPHGER
eukprot:552430-Hanusia_phi.AAC.2